MSTRPAARAWLSTGPLATNAPTDAAFGGSTADGRVVFFDTSELLVQGDGDFGWTDVYRVDLNEPPDCSGVAPSRSVLVHPEPQARAGHAATARATRTATL